MVGWTRCTYPSIHFFVSRSRSVVDCARVQAFTLKLPQDHGRLTGEHMSKHSLFSWRRHSHDHGGLSGVVCGVLCCCVVVVRVCGVWWSLARSLSLSLLLSLLLSLSLVLSPFSVTRQNCNYFGQDGIARARTNEAEHVITSSGNWHRSLKKVFFTVLNHSWDLKSKRMHFRSTTHTKTIVVHKNCNVQSVVHVRRSVCLLFDQHNQDKEARRSSLSWGIVSCHRRPHEPYAMKCSYCFGAPSTWQRKQQNIAKVSAQASFVNRSWPKPILSDQTFKKQCRKMDTSAQRGHTTSQ